MTTPNDRTADLAEQVKARVRAADQERIGRRAAAAAEVAAKLREQGELRRRLAEVEKDLTALVKKATAELMTAKELAEFVGVKPVELTAGTIRRAPRKNGGPR